MKRAERKRISELRKDIGMRRSVNQKVIAKRLSWDGDVARMSEERFARRVEEP